MNVQDLERKLADLKDDSNLKNIKREIDACNNNLATLEQKRRDREKQVLDETHKLEQELERAREEERKKAA